MAGLAAYQSPLVSLCCLPHLCLAFWRQSAFMNFIFSKSTTLYPAAKLSNVWKSCKSFGKSSAHLKSRCPTRRHPVGHSADLWETHRSLLALGRYRLVSHRSGWHSSGWSDHFRVSFELGTSELPIWTWDSSEKSLFQQFPSTLHRAFSLKPKRSPTPGILAMFCKHFGKIEKWLPFRLDQKSY